MVPEPSAPCSVRRPVAVSRRERGVRWVVALTAATMVAELVAGTVTGSMALLADGWHMATHVGALGLASAAYALSRRYATHRAFTFGTGKVGVLAGYTSALGLGAVAVAMAVESIARLLQPGQVDHATALPVAALGLVVNLASAALLHAHGHADPGHAEHEDGHDHHDHDHDHDHDPNHRAAFLHVLADAFTSVLAIGALLAGQHLGWTWLDPVSGLVGGAVILQWATGLLRGTAAQLLDVAPSNGIEAEARAALESLGDVRVLDLHVWSQGGVRCCVATLDTLTPRDLAHYHAPLQGLRIEHRTVEVRVRG
jgi:cation diffusion facilitator family transporter